MAMNVFKALRKRVGGPWEAIKINDVLEVLQREVGGPIETVTLAEDVVVLNDENGRLKGRPENCEIDGISFVGTIMIVGVDGERFADCPEDVIEALKGVNDFYFNIR